MRKARPTIALISGPVRRLVCPNCSQDLSSGLEAARGHLSAACTAQVEVSSKNHDEVPNQVTERARTTTQRATSASPLWPGGRAEDASSRRLPINRHRDHSRKAEVVLTSPNTVQGVASPGLGSGDRR